jgi:predicted DNA-binding protein
MIEAFFLARHALHEIKHGLSAKGPQWALEDTDLAQNSN